MVNNFYGRFTSWKTLRYFCFVLTSARNSNKSFLYFKKYLWDIIDVILMKSYRQKNTLSKKSRIFAPADLIKLLKVLLTSLTHLENFNWRNLQVALFKSSVYIGLHMRFLAIAQFTKQLRYTKATHNNTRHMQHIQHTYNGMYNLYSGT